VHTSTFIPPELPCPTITPFYDSDSSVSSGIHLYGMPTIGVTPIPPSCQRGVVNQPPGLPDANNCRWAEAMYMPVERKLLLDFLFLPPAELSPPGSFYPQAPIYHLCKSGRYM
jgi:hypothetical protein